MVHASRGRLDPASEHLRSEVWILTRLAEKLLAGRPNVPVVDWAAWRADYRLIRSAISRVVPGFTDYEARIDLPGGFVLPHPPRDERRFATPSGRAEITVNELVYPRVKPGRLLLQTLRSHDQFNTTVYSYNDRYRGVANERMVVFMNQNDIGALGLTEGDLVEFTTVADDGIDRRVAGFKVVTYDVPAGCCAAYYPETNALLPLAHRDERSNTPAAKSVPVRITAMTPGAPAASQPEVPEQIPVAPLNLPGIA